VTWRERIHAARRAGRFTDADAKASGKWTTCAVGETAAAAGLDWVALDDYAPLGVRFCAAVWKHRIDEAERLLDRIEAAALEVKRHTLIESDD